MSKLVVSEFVSLDGVMEGPGPDSDFTSAGWTMPYTSDEFLAYKSDELRASAAMLLGRITYEGFARAWPQITDAGEYGDKINAMPKYVVSTTLQTASWNNSQIIASDIVAHVSELKTQLEGDILVFGSSVLLRFLMAHALVDEYRLLVYPVILGHGTHLFHKQVSSLELIGTKAYETGVILVKYRPKP